MDNASKALIMAGAILISIAIVGVGVYIFSSTSAIGDTAAGTMDATQAQTMNSSLRKYEGTKVKGTTVKEFMGYVDALNKNNTFPYPIVVTAPTIESNAYYTITMEDFEPEDQSGDGYLDVVTVTKN